MVRVSQTTKTLTSRLPADLYSTIAKIAKKRKTSLNKVVELALRDLVRKERHERLREGFMKMAEREETDESSRSGPSPR